MKLLLYFLQLSTALVIDQKSRRDSAGFDREGRPGQNSRNEREAQHRLSVREYQGLADQQLVRCLDDASPNAGLFHCGR